MERKLGKRGKRNSITRKPRLHPSIALPYVLLECSHDGAQAENHREGADQDTRPIEEDQQASDNFVFVIGLSSHSWQRDKTQSIQNRGRLQYKTQLANGASPNKEDF